MKKITKILLPIASTVTVAAPLTCLTSCSGWKIDESLVEIYEGNNQFYVSLYRKASVKSWDGWTGEASFQIGDTSYMAPKISFSPGNEHYITIFVIDNKLANLSAGTYKGKLKVKIINSDKADLDSAFNITLKVTTYGGIYLNKF